MINIVIGIDVDGVLTDIGEFKLKQILEYLRKNSKGNLDYLDEMSENDEVKELNFIKKNIFRFAKDVKPTLGASKNIKKLKNDGHTIYIITARLLARPSINKLMDPTGKLKNKMRKLVVDWLDEHQIFYDNIFFTNKDKSSTIIKNKIDVMIEDSVENIKSLSNITKVICMNREYNKNIKGNNIIRCYNWDEIYDKIKELF